MQPGLSTVVVVHQVVGSGTFVIAVIGLVLSVATVTWQVTSFLLTGPRVRVRLAESSTAVSEGAGSSLLTEEILLIHIANRGRSAVSIDQCVVYPADGKPGGGLSAGMDRRTPAMPGHRLEAQASTTLHLDLTLARTIAEARPNVPTPPKVYAVVTLGTGRQRKSKPLPIPRSSLPPKEGTPAAGAHPQGM